jgi:phage shock protein A
MGLWGEVENAADSVAHAGERAVDDVTGMLDSLNSLLTDAGLGDVVQELARLAEEAGRLKQQLESAASSTKWSGTAASAFRQHAGQRRRQVAELVQALDSAHTAVGAAYAIAGVF